MVASRDQHFKELNKEPMQANPVDFGLTKSEIKEQHYTLFLLKSNEFGS